MTSDDDETRRRRSLGRRLLHPLNKVRWTLEAMRWRAEYRDALAASRATARPGPFEVVLVLDHLKPRHNPAMLIRSADALGARAVHTVGMPYFNVRPSVGSVRNLPIVPHATMSECLETLRREGYTAFALEPAEDVAERRYLDATELPRRTAWIVGHEKTGISFRPSDHPDVVFLSIRQFGTVPCMNVAVSGSVALYEYARQHGPSLSPDDARPSRPRPG